MRPPRAQPLALSAGCCFVAALVFAMVVVGGITRLTESGLSITEWKPLSGAIPPLTQAEWVRAFALYQATPEYQQINGPGGHDPGRPSGTSIGGSSRTACSAG